MQRESQSPLGLRELLVTDARRKPVAVTPDPRGYSLNQVNKDITYLSEDRDVCQSPLTSRQIRPARGRN